MDILLKLKEKPKFKATENSINFELQKNSRIKLIITNAAKTIKKN